MPVSVTVRVIGAIVIAGERSSASWRCRRSSRRRHAPSRPPPIASAPAEPGEIAVERSPSLANGEKGLPAGHAAASRRRGRAGPRCRSRRSVPLKRDRDIAEDRAADHRVQRQLVGRRAQRAEIAHVADVGERPHWRRNRRARRGRSRRRRARRRPSRGCRASALSAGSISAPSGMPPMLPAKSNGWRSGAETMSRSLSSSERVLAIFERRASSGLALVDPQQARSRRGRSRRRRRSRSSRSVRR